MKINLVHVIVGIICLTEWSDLYTQGTRVSEIEHIKSQRNELGTNSSTKRLLEVERELSLEDNYITVNSGFYLLNPYEILNTNELAQGSSESLFYLEIGVNYVWAWNSERRWRFATEDIQSKKSFDGSKGITWFNPLKGIKYSDMQARLAYFIGNDNKTTASTIVGSGEFAGEMTLAVPFALGLFTRDGQMTNLGDRLSFYKQTTSAHTIASVFSYGATTDRSAYDVHHRIFAGLGYRAAFKEPFQNGGELQREVLVSLQFGCSWIESTEFVNSSSRTIKLRNGDIPDYELEAGPALELEFYYPLARSAFITFGSRIYGGHNPNPWNAFIGLTWSPDKLNKLFEN